MNETQRAVHNDVIANPGTTQAEIAGRVFYATSTVSAALRWLEERRLVERKYAGWRRPWKWFPWKRAQK